MFKTLLVEDDADKRQRLCRVLASVPSFDMENVEFAPDITTAKRRLIETAYELLILDIALPMRADQEVKVDAGLLLLEEITAQRTRYRVPAHIIGITGFEELYAKGLDRFSSRLLTLVYYDITSEEWEENLKARIFQILSANAARAGASIDYQSMLAVLCALPSELVSIRRLPWDWKQVTVPGDHTVYWKGCYTREGQERVVYAADSSRMGLPNAAVFAMKLIHSFRPRYLAMTGIAAGIRGKTEMGDVIVANPSWDGGSGKWTLKDGKPRFSAAPHQLPLSVEVRDKFKSISQDTALLARIKSQWPAEPPPTELRVRIGPLVSNASVLADSVSAERFQEQHRELLGLEMETYGVFAAAEECSSPRPIAFSLKSVVDFADGEKNDRYQTYAAFTSAEVLRHFAETYL